jgi:hypothetical protein
VQSLPRGFRAFHTLQQAAAKFRQMLLPAEIRHHSHILGPLLEKTCK